LIWRLNFVDLLRNNTDRRSLILDTCTIRIIFSCRQSRIAWCFCQQKLIRFCFWWWFLMTKLPRSLIWHSMSVQNLPGYFHLIFLRNRDFQDAQIAAGNNVLEVACYFVNLLCERFSIGCCDSFVGLKRGRKGGNDRGGLKESIVIFVWAQDDGFSRIHN